MRYNAENCLQIYLTSVLEPVPWYYCVMCNATVPSGVITSIVDAAVIEFGHAHNHTHLASTIVT